ncbi:MAG: YtxH domain-containing protein [Terriglobales bacterium]
MARDNNGFGWFLAGLGLGALVGVLYAPKSGRETRQTLMDAAEEGRDFVVTKGRQAREQVGQYSERGKEVLASQKEQFKAAYEAGVQAYREKTESKA